jgi:hypothetical protein
MKKLLMFGLLLIPVLGFSGCMALQKPMDNTLGTNPKTGCSYGVNCSQIPNKNSSHSSNTTQSQK